MLKHFPILCLSCFTRELLNEWVRVWTHEKPQQLNYCQINKTQQKLIPWCRHWRSKLLSANTICRNFRFIDFMIHRSHSKGYAFLYVVFPDELVIVFSRTKLHCPFSNEHYLRIYTWEERACNKLTEATQAKFLPFQYFLWFYPISLQLIWCGRHS